MAEPYVNPCTVHHEDASKVEFRVMVPGGRGGREDGIVYQGTDVERADFWLVRTANNGSWVERRTLSPWKRVLP